MNETAGKTQQTQSLTKFQLETVLNQHISDKILHNFVTGQLNRKLRLDKLQQHVKTSKFIL